MLSLGLCHEARHPGGWPSQDGGSHHMFGQSFFNTRATAADRIQRGYAPLRRIEAYWESLREETEQGSSLPQRSAIDPRGIGTDLRNAFILERISTRMSRLRVAGSVLNDLVGDSARGLPFARIFAPASHRTLARPLRHSFDHGVAAHLSIEVARNGLQPGCIGEIRLFPLRDHEGQTTRLLGAIAFAGRKPPLSRSLTLVDAHLAQSAYGDDSAHSTGRFRPTHVPYLRLLREDA